MEEVQNEDEIPCALTSVVSPGHEPDTSEPVPPNQNNSTLFFAGEADETEENSRLFRYTWRAKISKWLKVSQELCTIPIVHCIQQYNVLRVSLTSAEMGSL